MLSERNIYRNKWAESGKKVSPMTKCWRRDIQADGAEFGVTEAQEFAEALRRVNQDYECLYDHPTRAWHIYRVVARGATADGDELLYIDSCIDDMRVPFTYAKPCAMGHHVIDWLVATDVTMNGSLTAEEGFRIADVEAQRRADASAAKELVPDATMIEFSKDLYDAVKKERSGYGQKDAIPHQRRPAETIYFPVKHAIPC